MGAPGGVRYRRRVVDDTTVLIVTAVAALVSPLPFLAAVVAAILRRSRTGSVPRAAAAAVAFTGGLALGSMLVVPNDVTVTLPLVIVPAVAILGLLRARRRSQAGWLLAGVSLPWTLLWGAHLIAAVSGGPSEPATIVGAFAVGAVPFAIGVLLVLRGDPPAAAPSIDAPAGQPGSRVIGTVAEALRQPNLIGPFGQPEIAMLVAIVVLAIAVPFWIPATTPSVIRAAILSGVVAVLAAEVYVRSFPVRSRRAFEAFSWLGEWDLARARELSGGAVPTSKGAAERWLADRPDPAARPRELPLRIEILLFADRVEEARSLLDGLPTGTPDEAFERAALADLVDFRAGGQGDIPAMERAATAIQPETGDDRLRAEVTIAVARVRRLMADPDRTTDPIEPFLEVRDRLGRRADGQVGRAYRKRLIPVLFVVGMIFGLVGDALTLPLL